jgi:hypothetical protein
MYQIGRRNTSDKNDDHNEVIQVSQHPHNHYLLLQFYLFIVTVATIASLYYTTISYVDEPNNVARDEEGNFFISSDDDDTDVVTTTRRDRFLYESFLHENASNWIDTIFFHDDELLDDKNLTDVNGRVNGTNPTYASFPHDHDALPSLLPLKYTDFYGYILAIIALAIAAGGGIGGGTFEKSHYYIVGLLIRTNVDCSCHFHSTSMD